MGTEIKRAALVLHGLSEPDRAWALSQLPHEHRQALLAALDELRELGIPHDDSLRRGMSGDTAPRPPVNAESRALQDASASAVTVALQEESGPVIQAVLALQPWHWRDDVREALRSRLGHAELPAQSVQGPGASGRGAAFSASLASALRARLPAEGSSAAAAPSPVVTTGWLRRWRGLLPARRPA